MGKTYVRIQRDMWAGWEVVAWRWWWPFWVQAGGTNTHSSTQKAWDYAEGFLGGALDPINVNF